MEYLKTKQLTPTVKSEVLNLWNNEYPIQLNYTSMADFEHYLSSLADPSHILMIDEKQQIKGWYFDFIREEKRWFAIILDSNLHGQGFGTQLLNLAKDKETCLHGWVIDHNQDKKRNGKRYASPLNFYLKNGFELQPNTRLEKETISAALIKWVK